MLRFRPCVDCEGEEVGGCRVALSDREDKAEADLCRLELIAGVALLTKAKCCAVTASEQDGYDIPPCLLHRLRFMHRRLWNFVARHDHQ